MRNIINTLALIRATLNKRGYNRYVVSLKAGYSLSILTGSHLHSHELKTVEVALGKDEAFVFGYEDTDDSIIHYMSWALFLDFIGDMNSINEGKLDKTFEEVFKQYQEWAME
jgi:hypothetical protein